MMGVSVFQEYGKISEKEKDGEKRAKHEMQKL